MLFKNCRYAIMFGDLLTDEKCKDIVAALVDCDFSFMCAHGRPSIAPLLDLNYSNAEDFGSSRLSGDDKEKTKNLRPEKQGNYIPIRFRGNKKYTTLSSS